MKKRIKILIVFVALAFSLSIISTTYSRYVADANGDVALTFAKWQILINDEDITSGNVQSIDITPTIVDNDNVASGKLAPSGLGYYDIEIDVSNVETAFDMHISLDNEDMADLRISGYSIDDGEEVEIDDGQIDESFDYDEDLETINVRIYFEWYDVDDNSSSMDDEDDTEFVSENDEITITTNLSFEQRID